MSAPPSELTPQQRLIQVAALLARGVVRLKQSRTRYADPAERVVESAEESLEVAADSRLSGTRRDGV
jgi:hypothetical protein